MQQQEAAAINFNKGGAPTTKHWVQHLLWCCRTIDISGAEAGGPPKEEPATDVEREESLRALQELKGRVPLMSQDDVQSAIDRLLRQGVRTLQCAASMMVLDTVCACCCVSGW